MNRSYPGTPIVIITGQPAAAVQVESHRLFTFTLTTTFYIHHKALFKTLPSDMEAPSFVMPNNENEEGAVKRKHGEKANARKKLKEGRRKV